MVVILVSSVVLNESYFHGVSLCKLTVVRKSQLRALCPRSLRKKKNKNQREMEAAEQMHRRKVE